MFKFEPMDVLDDLGLSEEMENELRLKNRIGLLVVSQIITGSKASNKLQVGDILLSINDSTVDHFSVMTEQLDQSVGKTVSIQIERDGRNIGFDIEVDDLESIQPVEYFQFGNGVFLNVSYQHARANNVSTRGVYVADPGYVLDKVKIGAGSVITEVDGKPVSNVQEFKDYLLSLPEGQDFQIRYFDLIKSQQSKIMVTTMDTRLFSMKSCSRLDDKKFWQCAVNKSNGQGIKKQPTEPFNVNFVQQNDSVAEKLSRSMVRIDYKRPFIVEADFHSLLSGVGLIVDIEKGWVVTDKAAIPTMLGDAEITLWGKFENPGKSFSDSSPP